MVRETSIEAYKTIKANGLLSKRRLEVYEILFKHGPLTANEIVRIAKEKEPEANQTGFNARLSELKKMNVVKTKGTKRDDISNQRCCIWELTGEIPVKLAKEKTTKQKLAEANARIEELETFIAQMEDVPRGDSGGIASIEVYVARGSKEHKLWSDLRLKKYPGDY